MLVRISARVERGGRRDSGNVLDLELCDRFDEVLVDGDEVGSFLVVDQHVGKADEQPLLLVDRIGYPVAHRRYEEITDVGAVHRSNANANFFSLGHGSLRTYVVKGSALATQELLAPAQLLVLMLAHFFAALLQNTRHTFDLPKLRAGV